MHISASKPSHGLSLLASGGSGDLLPSEIPQRACREGGGGRGGSVSSATGAPQAGTSQPGSGSIWAEAPGARAVGKCLGTSVPSSCARNDRQPLRPPGRPSRPHQGPHLLSAPRKPLSLSSLCSCPSSRAQLTEDRGPQQWLGPAVCLGRASPGKGQRSGRAVPHADGGVGRGSFETQEPRSPTKPLTRTPSPHQTSFRPRDPALASPGKEAFPQTAEPCAGPAPPQPVRGIPRQVPRPRPCPRPHPHPHPHPYRHRDHHDHCYHRRHHPVTAT